MVHKRPIFFVTAISLFVTAAGLAVMAGWIFDISVLKSVFPSMVSMKLSTAIAFAASGITLYFIARAREGEIEKSQVALSITSLVIALLMGLYFFSSIFNITMRLEMIFVKETDAVKSAMPGRPSIPTMMNFILIALAAVMTLLNASRRPPLLKTIGVIVDLTGALAAAGYIFNAPLLYYYIEGVNSAMALHTALLFVLLGTGLLCL
jgi:hypothetical protein